MTAAAIVGILALVVTTIIQGINDSRRTIDATAVRDGLAARIRQQIALPLAIQLSQSQPGNNEYRNCVAPVAGGGACRAKRMLPFRLASVVGFVNAAPRIIADGNLAADGQCAARYTTRGETNCPAGRADCPGFHACAWFIATCPDASANTCNSAAASISLMFQIVPGRALTVDPRGRPSIWATADANAANPSGLQRAFPRFPRRNAEFVEIRGSLNRERQQCGAFAVAKSINADGTLNCECIRGHPAVGGTPNNPVCRPSPCECLVGERFGGFTEEITTGPDQGPAGRLICYKLELHKYEAPEDEIDDKGVVTCDAPYIPSVCDKASDPWMIDFDLGTCKVGPTTKKGSDDEVECSGREATCGCYKFNQNNFQVRPCG
jgi:hypothetical protein